VSDHEHRDPIECSYDALVDQYQGAIAERDRLRARVAWLGRAYRKAWLRRWSMKGIIRDLWESRRKAVAERDRLREQVANWGKHDPTGEDHMREMWEHAQRADAAEAERDRLRAAYDAATEAADAAAEAVGAMAMKVSALIAENNRLRAVVEAVGRYAESPNDETLAELLAALQALDGSGVMGGLPHAVQPIVDGIDDGAKGCAEGWERGGVLARRPDDDPSAATNLLHLDPLNEPEARLEALAHETTDAVHTSVRATTTPELSDDEDQLDGTANMGGHEAQQVGRRFRSNACIHEEHAQCEKVCPFCDDSCACPCHPWNEKVNADEFKRRYMGDESSICSRCGGLDQKCHICGRGTDEVGTDQGQDRGPAPEDPAVDRTGGGGPGAATRAPARLADVGGNESSAGGAPNV
jgi:hypothetical protein